jgi:hypothetical protein
VFVHGNHPATIRDHSKVESVTLSYEIPNGMNGATTHFKAGGDSTLLWPPSCFKQMNII